MGILTGMMYIKNIISNTCIQAGTELTELVRHMLSHTLPYNTYSKVN